MKKAIHGRAGPENATHIFGTEKFAIVNNITGTAATA